MYGLFYLFLIVALVSIVILVFVFTPAKRLVYVLNNIFPIGSIALGAIMTLAGRGIVGLPLIGIGLAIWQRNRMVAKSANKLKMQPAIIQSDELEICIFKEPKLSNADAFEGKMLAGDHRGKKLSTLSVAQLKDCAKDLSKTGEGAALFEAYLDCKIPGWRKNAQFDMPRRTRKTPRAGTMTEQQANQILGLTAGASADQIGQAHSLLMDRVDPERTNEGFFAAKFNAALQMLL